MSVCPAYSREQSAAIQTACLIAVHGNGNRRVGGHDRAGIELKTLIGFNKPVSASTKAQRVARLSCWGT